MTRRVDSSGGLGWQDRSQTLQQRRAPEGCGSPVATYRMCRTMPTKKAGRDTRPRRLDVDAGRGRACGRRPRRRPDHRRRHELRVHARAAGRRRLAASQVLGELHDPGPDRRLVEHRRGSCPRCGAAARRSRGPRRGTRSRRGSRRSTNSSSVVASRAGGAHRPAPPSPISSSSAREHRLLVGEVVVERPAREVGAPDDVAHARRAVADVGEHLARCARIAARLAAFVRSRLPTAVRITRPPPPSALPATRGAIGSGKPAARARSAPARARARGRAGSRRSRPGSCGAWRRRSAGASRRSPRGCPRSISARPGRRYSPRR